MDVPKGFDPVLHAPARLQIAAILTQAHDAEFALLKSITGVSDSVLSKHLSALADAGYVKVRKATAGGRQRTWATLSSAGRAAFRRHVEALEALAATIVPNDRRLQREAGEAASRKAD